LRIHGPVGIALIFLLGSSFSFLDGLIELLWLALLDALEGVVTVFVAAVLLALTPNYKGRSFLI